MSALIKPRNILHLTCEEKRQFLNSFDHIFCDIDGVIWNLAQVIDGTDAGFNALRDAGKHFAFITNNSVRAEEQCIKKLKKINIDIDSNDLIHPAKSISEYLKSIKFEGQIYALASENFKKFLTVDGFQILEETSVVIDETFEAMIPQVVSKAQIKAVIVDFDFNLSLVKMMRAHFFLRNPECLFIGGASDTLLPVTSNLTLLGPGGFAKILQDVCKQELLVFGKPGKALTTFLMKRFDIQDASRVLMIGDMLEQDIRFGNESGFQSLLVLSGGTSYEQMIKQTDPAVMPAYYAQSLQDFEEFMKDIKKAHS